MNAYKKIYTVVKIGIKNISSAVIDKIFYWITKKYIYYKFSILKHSYAEYNSGI